MNETERVLDTGYVIIDDNGDYLTANRGIFVTTRYAQQHCDRHNKHSNNKWKVYKVKLVIVEE